MLHLLYLMAPLISHLTCAEVVVGVVEPPELLREEVVVEVQRHFIYSWNPSPPTHNSIYKLQQEALLWERTWMGTLVVTPL